MTKAEIPKVLGESPKVREGVDGESNVEQMLTIALGGKSGRTRGKGVLDLEMCGKQTNQGWFLKSSLI